MRPTAHGEHGEVERLQRVYAAYQSGGARERWSGENAGNRAVSAERFRILGAMLHAAGYLPLAGCRVLDVGCGSGDILAACKAWEARSEDLVGVDLLSDRVEAARVAHPDLTFQQVNAEALPFEPESFDLVLLFTVFTSILDPGMASRVAAEVQRVLRPGGAILWYDFRYDNPRNPHVRGVGRKRIHELFPGFEIRLRSITLLPPLARRLGPVTPLLYPFLMRLPLLRTHYAGLLTRADGLSGGPA